jgi:hypothetical protein
MRFAVQVRGHNFLVHFDGEPEPRPHGFLTQVEVEAADEAGAETAAIQLLRQTPKLRNLVLNTRENPPRMFVQRMGEYESGPVPSLTVEPSLIWFPEDGTDSDEPDAEPDAASDRGGR